jgi:hypothetical protein
MTITTAEINTKWPKLALTVLNMKRHLSSIKASRLDTETKRRVLTLTNILMARGMSRRNAASRLGLSESILRDWQESVPVSNGVDNYQESALTEFSHEQATLCRVLKYSNQPAIRAITARALYTSGLSKTTIANITSVDSMSIERLMKAQYKL